MYNVSSQRNNQIKLTHYDDTKSLVECCNSLFSCIQTCYCVGMVSVPSASRYQSRSSMYIRGLIPRIWPRQFRLEIIVDLCFGRHEVLLESKLNNMDLRLASVNFEVYCSITPLVRLNISQ